jgi:HK97 family phage major capsid protein
MTETAKLVTLLEAQAKSIQDLTAGVGAFKEEVKSQFAAVDTKIEKASAIYKDDAGRSIAAPYMTRGSVGKDSQPLLITNVLRSLRVKDWSLAKNEKEMSDKLTAIGYNTAEMGGVLFPMAPEHIPDEHAPLREEISKRLSLEALDYGEVAWLLKKFPSVAKAFDLLYKDLKLGDDTLGGFLVPIVQADRVIDLLRNRVVLQRAGATEISLPPSGNVSWPKSTGDPTFGWGDPDRTVDISVSDSAFGMLRFIAKQLAGAVAIPNDLIRYSSPSVEVVVRQMLASRAAVVEDAAGFSGAGTSFEPKGILNYATSLTPGSPGFVTLHVASTVGVDGNTFEPEDVAIMVAKSEESNDPDMPTAWIMRPLMWARILNKRADAVTAGDKKGPFMFPVTRGEAGRAPEKRLLDIPVLTTKQVPNNRTKGASTDLTAIFLANWRRFIIARSGALELAASEHVRFLRDQTVIKAILRVDFGLEYEESFVYTDTIDMDL